MLYVQETWTVKRHSLSLLMMSLVGIGLCCYGVSTNALELGEIAQEDNDGGFVINGVNTGDQTGHSVSNIGDMNGDGLADLFIGVPFADHDGNADAGKSYVIFGKSDGSAIDLSDIEAGNDGGFAIVNDDGASTSTYAGYQVSGVGDVNGDSIPDLLIGAFYSTANAQARAGKSYVIWGEKNYSTPIRLSDVAAGVNGFVINGFVADGYSGRSVAGAGDVNQDGLDDVVIGAIGGGAYVVFGKKMALQWNYLR